MLYALHAQVPRLDPSAYCAPSADVIGAVVVGPGSSIWFGAVLRGDDNTITIGARSNVQDHVTLHVDAQHPLRIGDEVTIGHTAVVHGCTIEDQVLIGMGAIVMDGAHIERGSVIAAGALVTPGTRVPAGSLVAGVPGKVLRPVQDKERAMIAGAAEVYARRGPDFAARLRPIPPEGE